MMGYLEVKFVIVIVVFFLGVNVNDFKVALMFMATCLRRKMFFFNISPVYRNHGTHAHGTRSSSDLTCTRTSSDF